MYEDLLCFNEIMKLFNGGIISDFWFYYEMRGGICLYSYKDLWMGYGDKSVFIIEDYN